MQEYSDPHDVLTVRVDGSDVDGVVVRNGWRDHYSVEEFTTAINDLLKQAIPVREEPTPDAEPVSERELSVEEQIVFWNEFMLYESRMDKLRQRILAGELTPEDREVEVSDPRQRVGVLYLDGAFHEIGFDPTWLAEAPMQTLSETITETLRQRPLATDLPMDPDLADVAERRATLRAILRGR